MSETIYETLAEDEPRDERSLQAWLVGIGSSEDHFATAGRIVVVEPDRTVLFGRDDSRELTLYEEPQHLRVGLPFGWASGRHAELAVGREDDALGFELRDLGSRNGTFVNGRRIAEPTVLRPGDIVEIGRSFWTLRPVRFRHARAQKLAELDPTGTCNPYLHHVERTLRRLAASTLPIVLRGETGAGKQHLARAIHHLSGRRGSFVVANLAALSPERAEALLFGGPDRPGLFEQADGGTLLLDEVAELTPRIQMRLLSTLVEGRSLRAGDDTPRQLDVRIVTSTLVDLAHKVKTGEFRADLYSRLAGFVADLPPLRARREDLGLLCRAFIRRVEGHDSGLRLSTNAFRALLARPWPFNIRQLEQTLAAAGMLATNDGLITGDTIATVLEQDEGLPQSPDDVQRMRGELLRQLAAHHGDAARVAATMHMPVSELEQWMQRYALEPSAYHQ